MSDLISYDLEDIIIMTGHSVCVVDGKVMVDPELPLKLAAAETVEFERQEQPKKEGVDTWRDRAIKEPIFW